MIRNAGSIAAFTEDGSPAHGAEQRADASLILAQKRAVKDRWMGELIRRASGRQAASESAPTAALPPPPEHLPARLGERLEQAVRWGYQERDFASYEASLSHKATFGEFLSWARQRRGFSPEELGTRADLSPREIQELERDSVSPLDVDPEKMARLSRALDASIWTLIERLRPSVNGKAPQASAMLLPETAGVDADAVWSSDGLRASEPFERVSLRKGEAPVPLPDDWTAYRQALHRAWRALKPS